MCERCERKMEQDRAKIMADIRTLAAGELPEGVDYGESGETAADREEFRASLIAARASCIIASHKRIMPSFAAGEIAGMLLHAELLEMEADRQAEQAIRDSAPFN